MPIPLVWLGAGIAAAFAGSKVLREQQKSRGHINHFPGESQQTVTPVNGAVVCCGIYELFQHSGIWFDGGIIELKGNGLVRSVTPDRFISNRSGNRIYVACNAALRPLASTSCAQRATSHLFEYQEYDLINNNCHRFTLGCVLANDCKVTRFGELNAKLSEIFKTPIYWQPVDFD